MSTPSEADPNPDREPDPESVARTILLDQLTARARTRKELADKLAQRGVTPEVAEPLLDRFTELGLIDDAAFARLWVEQRRRTKGLARRALGQELRRKGIDDDIVAEALDDVDAGEEATVARALVQRKLRSPARVAPEVLTRRLVAMLGRKGFPPGLAYAVVRAELENAGHDDIGAGDPPDWVAASGD